MKSIILSFFFAVASIAASAQFEIRPFIGANFSNVTKSPDGTSTQAKIGGQLGASVLVGNKFHLMPGISLFSRSTEYSSPGAVNIDQTVNGVLIPLLVGYRFVDPANEPFINFRLFTGPSLMFLTKTELNNSVADESVDWNNNQWGYQIGAGLDIAVFFVDMSYEVGLSNTGESKNSLSNVTDIKSNTFIINAGIRLSLAR
jgi:hypothetical protein